MNHWKVFCDEERWPGLWPRWFDAQCVAVGWPPQTFQFDKRAVGDAAWSRTRNYLEKVRPGDRIAVHLSKNRLGRLGEVLKVAVLDGEWDPLVPPSEDPPYGEQGRRIHVRWDLSGGPKDRDMVILLPDEVRLSRSQARFALSRLSEKDFCSLEEAARERLNWVFSNRARFAIERHLSDYLSVFPSSLEDGLRVLDPNRVREVSLADGSRADLLLADKDGNPVVVECKDGTPEVADVRQLRKYMELVEKETGKRTRGILVHGGSVNLRREVKAEAIAKKSEIEIVKYAMSLEFIPCR